MQPEECVAVQTKERERERERRGETSKDFHKRRQTWKSNVDPDMN